LIGNSIAGLRLTKGENGLACKLKSLNSSGMQWTEERLSTLPERGGYRLRGESMTRIEVFSDAAFAFAVTMLVISLSSIPKDFEELILAVKGIPSFAASFTVMMIIWVAHRRWSQRFGLDDGLSTILTLSLVFVVLVYVYPLKLIMELMFFGFSNSWFPSQFTVTSNSEVAGLVAFYSVGFFLVAAIQAGLYLRAASKAEELCLSRLEQVLIRKEQITWVVQAIAGLLSASIALIFISSFGFLAGIIFGLTPIALFLLTIPVRRSIREIQGTTG
jgi:uncharacterized membrane protein